MEEIPHTHYLRAEYLDTLDENSIFEKYYPEIINEDKDYVYLIEEIFGKIVHLLGVYHPTEANYIKEMTALLDAERDMVFLTEKSIRRSKTTGIKECICNTTNSIMYEGKYKGRIIAADSRAEIPSYWVTNHNTKSFNIKYKKKYEKFFKYHRNYKMLADTAISQYKKTWCYVRFYKHLKEERRKAIDFLIEDVYSFSELTIPNFDACTKFRDFYLINMTYLFILSYLNDVSLLILIFASKYKHNGIFYGKFHAINLQRMIKKINAVLLKADA